MIRFSGFGDEISPDIEDQMETLAGENVSHIELRGVGGKNILDLTPDELEETKRKMDDAGFAASAIGSPIGKIRIDEDFDAHLDRFKHAIEVAKLFDTPYIRLFSYYPPEGGNIADHRSEVMRRMQAKVKLAEEAGIVACHENEGRIYGEGPKECRDILESISSPSLRAVFDPANFVIAGYKPFNDCWELLKAHTEYFHIKDAKLDSKEICPAGEGDGQIKSVLKDAVAGGFEGFVSLEPHLAKAGQFAGFSGPERFVQAIRALKGVLDGIGADYDAK